MTFKIDLDTVRFLGEEKGVDKFCFLKETVTKETGTLEILAYFTDAPN